MSPAVLVAPTAFKGTLSPSAVADALAAGIRRVWPAATILRRPLSDGGTGLLDAYSSLVGGRLEELEVTGPRGSPVTARLLRVGTTTVIESAEACGLHRVPVDARDPMTATTRGVGELLLHGREGARKIILGLGGSATVDGGTGMARALGWSFTDSEDRPIPEGGALLSALRRVRPAENEWGTPVTALCDVENPLLGPRGAARVFGPQKGADASQVKQLEAGLRCLAGVMERDLGRVVDGTVGGGAAGGLGAGAFWFLRARLVAGADWMMERAGIETALPVSDLVVTGEGRFDAQSGMGKLTGRLARAGREKGAPVVLICGRIDGPLPPGIRGRDGSGRTLGPDELTHLAESACRDLVAEGRL